MQIPLSSETGLLSLREGGTHAVRLQSPVRVRVRCGLVWLTVEEGGADVWLSPGRDFDFHGRGLAVFEAVKGDAEFEVQPLPGWCTGLLRRLRQWWRPARAGCGVDPTGDSALRISRLLPRGLIRWF